MLDALKKNTGDPLVLRALARVVRNENENEFVRKAAYHATQSILHDPTPRERLERLRKPFNPVKDVDWDMVNAYL